MRRGKRKKFHLKNIRRFLCFCFPFGKKKADAYQIESDSEDLEAQFCFSQTREDNLEVCVDDTVCALSQNELSPGNEMCIQAGDEDCSPRQWLPKRKVLSIADISPEAFLAFIIPGICDSLPSWHQYMYQREDVPGFIFMYPSNNSSTVSCMYYYQTSLVYYAICLWRLYLQWQAYTQIGTSAGRDVCRVVALSNRAVLRNFLMEASKLTHIEEVSKGFMNNQYTIETCVTSVPAHPALFKAIFGHLYYRKVGYSYGVSVVVVQNIAIGMKRFGDVKPEYPRQRAFGGQLVPYSRLTNGAIGLSPSLQAMSYRGTLQNTTRPVPLPRWKVVMYNDLHPSTVNVVRLQNKEICKVLNRYGDMKPFGGQLVQYSRPTNASIGPSPSLQVMPYRGTVQNTTRPVTLPRWKVVMYSELHPSTGNVVRLQNKQICKVLNRYVDIKPEYPGQRPFGGELVQYSRPTNASIDPSPSLQVMPYRGIVENTTRPLPLGLPIWKLVLYSDIQPVGIVHLQKTVTRPSIGTSHPQMMGHFMSFKDHLRTITTRSIVLPEHLHVNAFTNILSSREYLLKGIWTIPTFTILSVSRRILASSLTNHALMDSMNNVNQNIMENDDDGNDDQDDDDDDDDNDDDDDDDDGDNGDDDGDDGDNGDDVHEDLNSDSNVDNIKSQTSSANVNVTVMDDNEVMVKIDGRTKVNDVGYIPGASDHVISYVESLDNMSPDDTAPLVKTHPKAILHASSDPPPPQDHHKRTDLLTDSMNNVNQNIIENDVDGNEHDDEDDNDDDDDEDNVHEDVNSDSDVDNIKSQTSSANVNVTVIGDNDVMVKIDALTKVGYNPGASDHVISYVDSLDNMSPDDTAPLVKTHPKAILHASSDPPPPQDQHKRIDLLTDSMNNVHQNIIENDVDGYDDQDDDDYDDGDDDVHEDVNNYSNVDNIKSETSSANVNVTEIGDSEVMVKIDARTKVNDVDYNPGASDHVISYVDSLEDMSPDDTAPLAKTHPKAILHASSDPPPPQYQHKRTDLLTVADNSSQFESRTYDIGLTVSNPSMFALFEQPGYSLDAAPLFILHTEMRNHNGRKRTKLIDTAICICALAFSTTISPRRWDRELLNLIVEDAAGVEATILQYTKKEDCSMDQLPQNVNITFESLHSGPQSLRLGIKQIISGSLTSLGSAPSKDCLRTTHSDLNDLLTALKLALKLHSSIGAVMWCADTVYAVMSVRYNKVAQYKEDRVLLLTITQTDLIMEIFESLSGCVTFITSLFDSPETFRLLPIYKYTSSLHHVMQYFKMSK